MNTQSGIMMTISIICGFLPTFFLSPFAGVWADRYNRKKLIILSDSLIAASTLLVAILFILGFDAFWMLFVVSAIRALGQGIQTPAVGAILPQLVPEEKLTRIGGINGSIQAIVMLVSPMVSGVLLSAAPLELIFFIDVFTALLAVIILSLLHFKLHAKAQEKQKVTYLNDLKEGIRYISQHSFIKRFFIFCASFFVLAAPVAFLTPLQVTRSYGNDVWRLTAIEITFSIGMMAGGIIIASWTVFRNKVYTMTSATLLMGATTFALGVTHNFIIYLILMVIFGLAMPIFNTPATVLLQEKVEENYLGRIFGVLGMISSSMMPIGMLLFGPLSDKVEIEVILIVTGILIMIQSLFMFGSKTLIEAGKPVEK
jgi:DHA3 family macrolide efflux protein-like MFS transporter